MSDSVWRILVSIVVGAHGIGHVLFLVGTLGLADWGQSAHSWLLTNTVGGGVTRALGAIIWLVSMVGFLAAAIGIWGRMDWWRTVAIVSAIVSALGLALFWSGGASGPLVSALAFDVVILVALILFRWPSPALIGS